MENILLYYGKGQPYSESFPATPALMTLLLSGSGAQVQPDFSRTYSLALEWHSQVTPTHNVKTEYYRSRYDFSLASFLVGMKKLKLNATLTEYCTTPFSRSPI